MLHCVENVSATNNSNCKNTFSSTKTAQMNHFLELINDVKPKDDLLDFKISNLSEAIREQLDNLHDEIVQDEGQELLLRRSNRLYAMFEMLVGLLPQSKDYFQNMNSVCLQAEGYFCQTKKTA